MAYNIHEEIVVEPRQYKNKESSPRRFCRRARQTENKKSSLRRRFPSMLCRGNFFLIRGIEMKFTFLSEAFYNEHIDHTEIEKKHDRPYVQVIIKVSSVFFAVRTYQKASLRRDVKRNDLLCRFSTLQYFEVELKGILSGE